MPKGRSAARSAGGFAGYKAPSVPPSEGDFVHGESFTITGTGFGTKPAQSPIKYYDGITDTTFDDTQGGDAGFRSSGWRSVSTPHSRIQKYWAAAKLDGSPPNNIFLLEYASAGSYPIDIYGSVYNRCDPSWVDAAGDRQRKPWTFGHATWYEVPYFYTGYENVDSGGGNYTGSEYRTGGDPGYPSGGYGEDSINPTKAWTRYEFLIRYTDQSSGYLYCWETTTLADIGRREVLAFTGANNLTGSAPDDISLMFGGYYRDYGADNYAYFTDLFFDYGPVRVVLTDSATLSGALYCEPQPYTAWSDTSITLTANAGAVPAGTAYLHVVSGRSTVITTQQVSIGGS